MYFLDEKRCFASLTDVAIKKATTAKYNKKVGPRAFHPKDPVLCHAIILGEGMLEKTSLNQIVKALTKCELGWTEKINLEYVSG